MRFLRTTGQLSLFAGKSKPLKRTNIGGMDRNCYLLRVLFFVIRWWNHTAALVGSVCGLRAFAPSTGSSHQQLFKSYLSRWLCGCSYRCVSGDISNPVTSIEDVDINMVANFCEIFAQVSRERLARWKLAVLAIMTPRHHRRLGVNVQ